MPRKRYNISMRFVFKGEVVIQADSLNEATRIAQDDFGMIAGNFHTSNDEAVLNWDFDIHPDEQILDHIAPIKF